MPLFLAVIITGLLLQAPVKSGFAASAPQLNAEGIRLVQQGRLAEAETKFRAAVAADEHYTDALSNLGVVLVSNGKPDAALPLLERARDLAPGNARVRGALALALEAVGRDAAAASELRRATTLDPRDGVLHRRLGRLLLRQQHFAAAVEELRTAITLGRGDRDTHYMLAQALQRAGKRDEAVKELGIVQVIDTQRKRAAEAHNDASDAVALIQSGETNSALEKLRHAVELNPNDFEARYNYGAVLLGTGEVAAAIKHLRAAQRLQPEDGDANYYLGRALVAAGRDGEAVPYLERTVRRRPVDARARNVLGVALARSGDEVRALAMMRSAVQLDPKVPAFTHNLACLEQQTAGCRLEP